MYSWIHTVVKNAHVIERRELDQTPGWAVALHFIPIALLFKPYIAVKQVRNTSQRQNLQTCSKLLGRWWGSWLGYSFLINLLPAIGFTLGLLPAFSDGYSSHESHRGNGSWGDSLPEETAASTSPTFSPVP